jgi:hypothetical protein
MGQKGFTKNDPNINRKGRPKGSTDEIRSELKRMLADSLPEFEKALQILAKEGGAQYLRAMELLIKTCLPPLINPESPTEQTLLEVLQYIRNQKKDETQPIPY